jgi:hypothetical protein
MHAKLAFNFMLSLSTKPFWVQINVLCVNVYLCCIWVQILVVFEYNCLLYYVNVCNSTPCKNGGTCSISGLVARVFVWMDSLGISVKAHLIFI